MGGATHPPIPDYKIYKVEGVKELERLEQRLAAHGLKDPWIRNEVWRYKGHQPPGTAAFRSLTRGFRYGFAAFLVSLAVEKIYHMSNPPRHASSGEH